MLASFHFVAVLMNSISFHTVETPSHEHFNNKEQQDGCYVILHSH